MKGKLIKFSILGVLLGIPVILLFLVDKAAIEGEKPLWLKVYHPVGTEEKTVDGKSVVDTIFHKVPVFELTDQEGKPFNSEQLAGKIYVADFIYTERQAITQAMCSEYLHLQETFSKDDKVRLVSFTLSQEHDSLEVMQSFANDYGANPAKWSLLGGDREKAFQLMQEGYKAQATKETGVNGMMVLVDRKGQIRGYYNVKDPKEMTRLETEIRVLLELAKQGRD